MKKVITAMLVGFFLILQGCAMAKGDLITKILDSSKPERFKPLDISSVVVRYIPLGTEKQVAIHELRQQGFEVKEVEQKLNGCIGCESQVVLGSYTQKAIIPFLPYKSFISIGLGFKQGKVTFVSAWHTKNAY